MVDLTEIVALSAESALGTGGSGAEGPKAGDGDAWQGALAAALWAALAGVGIAGAPVQSASAQPGAEAKASGEGAVPGAEAVVPLAARTGPGAASAIQGAGMTSNAPSAQSVTLAGEGALPPAQAEAPTGRGSTAPDEGAARPGNGGNGGNGENGGDPKRTDIAATTVVRPALEAGAALDAGAGQRAGAPRPLSDASGLAGTGLQLAQAAEAAAFRAAPSAPASQGSTAGGGAVASPEVAAVASEPARPGASVALRAGAQVESYGAAGGAALPAAGAAEPAGGASGPAPVPAGPPQAAPASAQVAPGPGQAAPGPGQAAPASAEAVPASAQAAPGPAHASAQGAAAGGGTASSSRPSQAVAEGERPEGRGLPDAPPARPDAGGAPAAPPPVATVQGPGHGPAQAGGPSPDAGSRGVPAEHAPPLDASGSQPAGSLAGAFRPGTDGQAVWQGRLDAGPLGSLTVRVALHTHEVSAHFGATPEAAPVLRQSAPELAEALLLDGLALAQFSVRAETGRGGSGAADGERAGHGAPAGRPVAAAAGVRMTQRIGTGELPLAGAVSREWRM